MQWALSVQSYEEEAGEVVSPQPTIAELKQMGRTQVIIAHRPSILANVDRILCLNDGILETLAPRDEIFDKFTPARRDSDPELAAAVAQLGQSIW